MLSNSKILVCVLNWGLGHASRSTALINTLLLSGNSIHLASSKEAGALLRANFPELSYHELPDYQIRYTSNGSQSFSVAKRGIGILNSIKKEHQVVNNLHKIHLFDCVISDNRLGCYVPEIKNTYLSHQLNIQGTGAWLANYLHHRYIKKFDEIWIPDIAGVDRLSGDLSKTTLSNVKYIGWLSQYISEGDESAFTSTPLGELDRNRKDFTSTPLGERDRDRKDFTSALLGEQKGKEKEKLANLISAPIKKQGFTSTPLDERDRNRKDFTSAPLGEQKGKEKEKLANLISASLGGPKVLAIISGPEPQRSIFEQKLLAMQHEVPMMIVGGDPKNKARENYIPFANQKTLRTLLQEADIIVSRNGYSSLMDLMLLNKKAVLIPTPGQPEQEYLAKHLSENKAFAFIAQNDLNASTLKKSILALSLGHSKRKNRTFT